MDPDRQINIGRYMRFVAVFLLIMFSVLGVYEYYYGSAAREAQGLQEEFNRNGYPGAYVVVTTTIP